jgi:hypothetical protein
MHGQFPRYPIIAQQMPQNLKRVSIISNTAMLNVVCMAMIIPYLFVHDFKRVNPGQITRNYECISNSSLTVEEKENGVEFKTSTWSSVIIQLANGDIFGLDCYEGSDACSVRGFTRFTSDEFERWLAAIFRDMNCIDSERATEEKPTHSKSYQPLLDIILEKLED